MTCRRIRYASRLCLGVALALSGAARPAFALQPVTDFIAHARTWNPQNRAAHATTAQREAEADVSKGNLLPNFSATGMYTRNQYEVTTGALTGGVSLPPGVSFGNVVIQPLNQLDANLILTVPLINVANWDRKAAAESTVAGARADEANSELTIEKNVLRD
jgi:outer membrane protein TolC